METVRQDLSRFEWEKIENLKTVDAFGRRANKKTTKKTTIRYIFHVSVIKV